MSSSLQDYLARQYGEGQQQTSDFETAKPKKKKGAKAAVKPIQGFKLIEDAGEFDDYEDFTSGVPKKKSELVVDYTADTKRRQLQLQEQSHSDEPRDSSPPRRPRAAREHEPVHSAASSHAAPSESSYRSADLSPPRCRQESSNSPRDSSPPRRPRSSNADLSPPRHGAPNPHRSTTTVDLSPPRRGRAPSPPSPQRRTSDDTDLSLPRQRSTDGGLSPPRRRGSQDQDEAPNEEGFESPPRKRRAELDREPSPPRSAANTMKMMSGERAGLHTGAEITAEARRRRAIEDAQLAADAAMLQDDEPVRTVYRDEFGRKIDPNEAPEPVVDKKALHESTASKRAREEERRRYDPDEAKHGYRGRSHDDENLNMAQKGRDRWDDPLARMKDSGVMDDGDDDFEDPMRMFGKSKKKRKREEEARKNFSKEWSGYFPPNRFNIRPGRQWDGVDRSNGFEGKAHQVQLDKQYKAEQAYRYTSSDM